MGVVMVVGLAVSTGNENEKKDDDADGGGGDTPVAVSERLFRRFVFVWRCGASSPSLPVPDTDEGDRQRRRGGRAGGDGGDVAPTAAEVDDGPRWPGGVSPSMIVIVWAGGSGRAERRGEAEERGVGPQGVPPLAWRFPSFPPLGCRASTEAVEKGGTKWFGVAGRRAGGSGKEEEEKERSPFFGVAKEDPVAGVSFIWGPKGETAVERSTEEEGGKEKEEDAEGGENVSTFDACGNAGRTIASFLPEGTEFIGKTQKRKEEEEAREA